MWHAAQTRLNVSSPVGPLKSALAEAASAVDCASAEAAMTPVRARQPAIRATVGLRFMLMSSCLHALMEPPDRIECGGDRAFLPAADVRGMLAGDHEAPVDLAQVAIVLGAGFLVPHGEAAERPGHAMPADRDPVEELLA